MNLLILILLIIVISPRARAGLSEPPSIVYGAVSLNNQPVTAARADVLIEARRLLNGPALASYHMGSDAAAGNFYSLRIPIESLAPANNPAAAQAGETLYIVVTDGVGHRQDATCRLGGRGAVQRLDLGPVLLDNDTDYLPDAWEMLYFGNLNREWSTICPNGLIAWANYQAGSDPNSTNGLFRVASQLSGDQLVISFFARRASGAGYEGAVRHYFLEAASDAVTGPWTAVPGFTDVVGNDRTITFQTAFPNAPMFFRGQVWVEGWP
jgi:hypothetical protein